MDGTQPDRRAIPAVASEAWWTAPDGQKIRRIDWPASAEPARGSLLYLPGRGDFYEKYLEALDHWYRQGWAVTALDWRGQGYSGRLGDGGNTGHVDDFAVWADDLAAFWRDWTAARPGPHAIVGHSMGGHIVLRALTAGKLAPDAAVLAAPMLGLRPAILPRGLLHAVARAMVRLRGASRSAWSGTERPGRSPADRIELLTHDADRYADEAWWREHRPQLSLGPPSWGWIERAYASMAMIERPGALEAVDVPVLILATAADKLVSYPAITAAADRLPHARLLTFGPEARHEILREVDAVRLKALAAIDDFLSCAAPATPATSAIQPTPAA